MCYLLSPVIWLLVVLALVAIGIKLLVRVIVTLSGSRRGHRMPPRPTSGAWMRGMCTSNGCRHVNPPHALYCARCGRSLAQ